MTHEPDRLSDATVLRLPTYLRALAELEARGVTSVSSEELAVRSGVNSAKLRKDLSHLGSYGVRGVGYDVRVLADEVSKVLGLAQVRPVVIVGMGHLGHALADFGGFATKGFDVVACFDRDPDIVGRRIGGLDVHPMSELPQVLARVDPRGDAIAVIATPAASAQGAADDLVEAGVRSVLNFAPVHLAVPQGTDVRKVDLSTELQLLAFHAMHRDALPGGGPATGSDLSTSEVLS